LSTSRSKYKNKEYNRVESFETSHDLGTDRVMAYRFKHKQIKIQERGISFDQRVESPEKSSDLSTK
jgi:hypothetical protein